MENPTMMKQLYKNKNSFGNVVKKRRDNNERLQNERKDRRTKMFNVGRNIPDISPDETNVGPSVQKKMMNDRKAALELYRQKKEAINAAQKTKKKPPFVVGIPHHGNSPLLKEINPPNTTKLEKQMRTRNNVKLEQQVNKNSTKSPFKMFPFDGKSPSFKFQMKSVANLKKLTSPHTPTVLRRSSKKDVRRQPLRETTNKIMANEIKNTRQLRNRLKELQKPKKTSSTSTDSGSSMAAPLAEQTVIQDVTPPVVKNEESQEEVNEQHEITASVNESQNNIVEESQSTTNIPKSSTSPAITEQLSANPDVFFQRERVDGESRRLLALAEDWETISLREKLPQDVVDEIDSLVGQTRLLTRDKFNQHRRLIDQFEQQKDSQKITIEDLNGFWDMVFLQVESLMKRYAALDELKLNNWKAPKVETPTKRKRRAPSNKNKINKKAQTLPNQSIMTPSSQASHTPRRDSPAPYIAMRLSGVGRCGSQTETEAAGPLNARASILKRAKATENTPKKSVVFNGNPVFERVSDLLSVMKQENITEDDQEVSPLRTESQIVFTPRRSIRLQSKTPTPLLVRICPDCKSPDCKSANCAKGTKSKKIRKTPRPATVKQEVENLPLESQNEENTDQELPAPERQKFVLRASKLILTTDDSTPKKTRRTLQEKDHNSQLSVVDPQSSAVGRRSTRASKKVTFPLSTENKAKMKLPVTPFRKKGSKNDSYSDDSSE